jgi:hypothetical protein
VRRSLKASSGDANCSIACQSLADVILPASGLTRDRRGEPGHLGKEGLGDNLGFLTNGWPLVWYEVVLVINSAFISHRHEC